MAVVFEVNKCDHKKCTLNFIARISLFWLFDFNHISEHNQTYRTPIPYAITHSLLHSQRHDGSVLRAHYMWLGDVRMFIVVQARASLHRVPARAEHMEHSSRRTQKEWKSHIYLPVLLYSYASLWLLSFPHFQRRRHSIFCVRVCVAPFRRCERLIF